MAAQGKHHRFIYIATAFVALMFMGLIYAWSLFVEPIEADFGWERAQTSLIFTLSMIAFSVGMVAAGIIEQRFNPRIVMVATAIIIAGGFIAAAQTTTLTWIYITYGIIVGFGVGAMLLNPLVTVLLGKFSWQTTFLILGIVFGIVMLAVTLIVKLPPAEFAASMQAASNDARPREQKRDYSAVEMIKTRSFQLAFLWLILVSNGGLGLISQAVPAAEEVLSATGMDAAASAMMATAAMGGISLCNGFGRLLCGLVWDKFGYRVSFLWISVGFALSMLLCGVAVMLSSFPLIVAGFMLLGLIYGGNMASIAVISSSFFGPKYFGINYAVATLQMIASASAGPLVLATLQTSTGSYGPAFWVFLGVAAAALALSFAIKSPQETKEKTSRP